VTTPAAPLGERAVPDSSDWTARTRYATAYRYADRSDDSTSLVVTEALLHELEVCGSLGSETLRPCGFRLSRSLKSIAPLELGCATFTGIQGRRGGPGRSGFDRHPALIRPRGLGAAGRDRHP
jgi:hypothetical protein